MEEKENVVKFTISMEKELRNWVDAKVKAMNRKDRRFKTSRSALIADAVQTLKDSEEQAPDKASDVSDDDKILRPEVLYPTGIPSDMRLGKTNTKKPSPKKTA
jgi:hypothetical protein